ncbi:hypothetical protein [Herbaspirillum sp. RV1423]|uniref:hypothetical protein n=1 Tax=Herbaspirillum sp. RV1423 TaxID=1443993 RepID=UPI000553D37D|nr:hypothetical protein [Herbaspirillum sp. RV1423]
METAAHLLENLIYFYTTSVIYRIDIAGLLCQIADAEVNPLSQMQMRVVEMEEKKGAKRMFSLAPRC